MKSGMILLNTVTRILWGDDDDNGVDYSGDNDNRWGNSTPRPECVAHNYSARLVYMRS